MATSARPNEGWWVPVFRFGVHVWAATGIFLVVAGAAVGLDFLIQWLTRHNVSPLVLAGLQLAEYTIFGVDVLLLIIFVVRSATRSVREM